VDPVIQPWVDLWDYLDGNFWGVWRWAMATLNPNQVSWRPNPQVASIGWNLQHLGEMLDYYLTYVFNQGPAVQQMPLVTMRSGSRDDGRFHDLQEIATYHRQVRPAYRTWLTGLSAGDFSRTIERSKSRQITLAWGVGHIAEHESYHIGKCTLLRNLLPRE
jgi:hypothetical protein